MFTYSSNQFQEIIEFMLAEAGRRGASDAIAEVSEGQGLAVTVRKGEVETIEQSLDKQVGVTVFLGHRRGNASTSDFSQASLRATVEAAYHIAQHTAEDDCAGPAEPELLEKKPKDLDYFIHGQLMQSRLSRLRVLRKLLPLQSANKFVIVMAPLYQPIMGIS